MALRQVPAVLASLFLGVSLAEIGNAPRGPDLAQPAVHGGPQKTVAAALSQNKTAENAKPQSSDNSRSRSERHERYGTTYTAPSPQWQGPFDTYGIYNGGPYDGDRPVVYWAPGRWYPYPGFGDKRSLPPQPDGVWSR